MTNTITTYDRGYASIELMLKHMSINSHFIIRLRVDDFDHERKNMKTNDETIDITINAIRTQNFHDEETKKKKALESRSGEIRITEIELETKKKGKKYTEILASNLPSEKFTTQGFKRTIQQKMENRKPILTD